MTRAGKGGKLRLERQRSLRHQGLPPGISEACPSAQTLADITLPQCGCSPSAWHPPAADAGGGDSLQSVCCIHPCDYVACSMGLPMLRKANMSCLSVSMHKLTSTWWEGGLTPSSLLLCSTSYRTCTLQVLVCVLSMMASCQMLAAGYLHALTGPWTEPAPWMYNGWDAKQPSNEQQCCLQLLYTCLDRAQLVHAYLGRTCQAGLTTT